MEAERLGKYMLVQHLASGGMANVYLARLTGLGGFERHVVLKTLRTEDVDDDSRVPMFLDEARLVATLHHQHIAQVFEVGRDATTYYLAMEYVHGETVRCILETANRLGRTLPLDFALTVVCAAAAGLHHAHERCAQDGTPLGIVHRDVTPSNVIASYDGSVKLIDFGIAKAAARSTVTQTGLIKGKVGYMAPEQVRGYVVDRRADVFALGVLAYELTTQRRAFDAATQFEQLERTAHRDVIPPTGLVPRYPQALEDVVMTALELDPDDRYASAEAMRLAIVRVARELGLVLGEAAVVRVLGELFGRRPEPWLAAHLTGGEDVTPSIETAPFVMVRRPPLRPDPSAIAKGSSEVRAIVEAPAVEVGDDDETNPVELELATNEVELVVEPPLAPRATSLPLAAAPASPVPAPAVKLPLVMPEPPRFVLPPLVPRPVAPPSRRARWLVAAFAALALGAGAAVVVTLARTPLEVDALPPPVVVTPRATPPVTQREPAPPSSVPAPTPADAPPAPAGTVRLHVVTDPPNATVVLDGVRLGRTPFTTELPRKAGRATLKVRKAKYFPIKLEVSLERDVTWDVELRRR